MYFFVVPLYMGGLYMLDVFVSLNIIIITLRVLLSSDARHRQRWQKVLASHQILGFIAILYIFIIIITIIIVIVIIIVITIITITILYNEHCHQCQIVHHDHEHHHHCHIVQ